MDERLLRTSVFGGYNKEDVRSYIKKLEDELIRLQSYQGSNGGNAGGTATVMPANEPRVKEIEDVVILSDMMEKVITPEKTPVADPSVSAPEQAVAGRTAELEVHKESQEELEKLRKDLEDTQRQLKEKERQLEECKENLKLSEKRLLNSDLLREQNETKLQLAVLEKEKLQQEAEQLREERKSYEEDYKAVKNVLLNARVDAEIIVTKAKERANLLLEDTRRQINDQKRESVTVLMRKLTDNQNGLIASKVYLEEQVKNIERTKKEIENIQNSMEELLEDQQNESYTREYTETGSED